MSSAHSVMRRRGGTSLAITWAIMLFRVSAELEYEAKFPSTLILNIHAQRNASQAILDELSRRGYLSAVHVTAAAAATASA